MKKSLGSMLALYPMPATIVGAMIDGKPNWLQIAHVGVIRHDRLLVSSMKSHYTNFGIRKTGVLSVSLAQTRECSKNSISLVLNRARKRTNPTCLRGRAQ